MLKQPSKDDRPKLDLAKPSNVEQSSNENNGLSVKNVSNNSRIVDKNSSREKGCGRLLRWQKGGRSSRMISFRKK